MSDIDVLWLLSQHLLLTTGLAGIVWMICRYSRLSPSVSHLLWLLVLCRFLIPPVATWPWAIPAGLAGEHLPADKSQEAIHTEQDEPVSLVDAVPIATVDSSNASDHVPGVTTTQQAIPTVSTASLASVSKLRWVAVVWLLGSISVVGAMVAGIIRARRLLNHASAVDGWLLEDMERWCRHLGVRPPDIILSERVQSPFLWCFGAVRLVWPASQFITEKRDRSLTVLIHELAHVNRRDHWTAWLELLGMIVWWWNPVFWFVRRQLRTAAEMACDAWVVELLPDRRRSYAELLVEFSRHEPSRRLTLGTVGASVGSRRMFARRLEMIMSETGSLRFSRWLALSALISGLLSLPVLRLISPIRLTNQRTMQRRSQSARSRQQCGKL